jgi:hypothetical protein
MKTPQQRIMKVVKGCVKDVRNAHPNWKITDQMARSIAKRVAGTLSAMTPGELAGKPPSDRAKG